MKRTPENIERLALLIIDLRGSKGILHADPGEITRKYLSMGPLPTEEELKNWFRDENSIEFAKKYPNLKRLQEIYF